MAAAALSLALGVTRPRAAIVTGGTRGIGRAIAKALAPDYDLLLTYCSNQTAANALAAELRAQGVAVHCVGGDLAEPAIRRRVFEAYDAAFGATHELGAVVHSAGQYVGVTARNARELDARALCFGDGSLLALDPEYERARYYLDLYGLGFVDLCERALARMSDGGSLVGVSSPGGTVQYNPAVGYDLPGMGKCVMEYAMRLFALRGAPRNINCNVVVPGFTDTEAWARLAVAQRTTKDELMGHMTSKLAPMGRMRPEAIGAAVAFLCSDAGRRLTGLSLPVDGGVHLRI